MFNDVQGGSIQERRRPLTLNTIPCIFAKYDVQRSEIYLGATKVTCPKYIPLYMEESLL